MNSESTFRLKAVTAHDDRYVVFSVEGLLRQGCMIQASSGCRRPQVRVFGVGGEEVRVFTFLDLEVVEATDDRPWPEIIASAEVRGDYELDAEAERLFEALEAPAQ